MTIREYLESKPDNFAFEIVYQFDNWCPKCKRNSIDIDDEYSADGTAGEFRQQIAGSCTGFNHYKGYDFVYEDFEIGGSEVQLEETNSGAKITITVTGEERVCEECEGKHLDELSAEAAAPDVIILPTQEEMDEDMRKYNELLSWAQSLTPEQIAFLCDGGWYNNTMKGYAIRAAKEMELTEDQTRELVRCFSYALDMMDKEEAEKLYIDF
jgi:hypothetical protein